MALPANTDIEHSCFEAPDCLKEYVDCFWSIGKLSPKGRRLTVPSIADCTSSIVFQHQQGNTGFFKDGGTAVTSMVFGQKDSAVAYSTVSPFDLTAIQFKPWALHELLGADPGAMANGLIDLNECPVGDVNFKHFGNEEPMVRVSRLTRFLVEKLGTRSEPDRMIRHALKMIHDHPGSMGISDLLTYFGISDRQMERRFKKTVGVTPILYIRINRFTEALRRIRTGRYQKLSDVAYSLNYADQSHFNKDFSAFTGQTPSSFIKSDAILLGKDKFMMGIRPSFEQVS